MHMLLVFCFTPMLKCTIPVIKCTANDTAREREEERKKINLFFIANYAEIFAFHTGKDIP